MLTLRSHGLFAAVLLLIVATGCRTSDAGLEPNENSMPFSIDTAVEMARLNLYSYEHLTDFVDEVPFELPEGYELHANLITYEWFSGNTTEIVDYPTPIVLVATKGDDIFLLFRGSVTPSEWLDDASMVQRQFDEIPGQAWAHEGFVDVYRSIAPEMFSELDRLLAENENAKIWMTGHSLGGALATLAAVDIVQQRGVQPILYTFASPRVGDEAFRDVFHEKVHTSWRIVNINDYVPRYPPSKVSIARGETVETRQYRHVQAVYEVDFGTWFEAPSLDGSGFSEVDFDLATEENIDFGAIDWSSPSLKRNHGICHHYNYFCGFTVDPGACRLRADEQDGCNAD